jgi:proteasome lid subunit RPN8/RPN11
MTASQKVLGNFNDKMVSMEIMKIFEETPEHIAIIHSHPNYNGKKNGMEIGESLKIEISKINSIMIYPEHELFVYDNDTLKDIYSSNVTKTPNYCRPFLATVIAQKSSSEYAVFYDDVDYKGDHFTLLHSNPAHKDWLNGKCSSMRIPMNHEVVLYENENMQGAYITLSGDIPNLVFYLFNDRAQKIVYQEKSEKPIQNVVIYTNPNFTGETRILPIGYSKIQEVIYAGSIKVPEGFTVILEKLPIYPFNYERKSVYSADSSNTIDYFDTPLISVVVEL